MPPLTTCASYTGNPSSRRETRRNGRSNSVRKPSLPTSTTTTHCCHRLTPLQPEIPQQALKQEGIKNPNDGSVLLSSQYPFQDIEAGHDSFFQFIDLRFHGFHARFQPVHERLQP